MNSEKGNIEIRIVHEYELAKVLAFARAGTKKIRFRVPVEMIDSLLAVAEEYADERDIRLRFELVRPSGTEVICFGIIGASAGAGVGFIVAGLPGALVGAAAGAATGVAIATNLKISIVYGDEGTDACVSIA